MASMLFTGAYEHIIDAKNRLAIPSQVRAEMDPERDGLRFYVVPGQRPKTLSIYAERYFQRLADHRLIEPIADDDALEYDQMTFSTASPPLEPDKQGRILLPDRLLRLVGIGRQVMIIGVRDHLEVWNKSDYDEFLSRNWARYADILLRARRTMRQSPPERGASR